ncbi:MAG: hypothetical protein RL329_3988 [Bacteroidota bacterium]|jgi:hypothetical protein
MILLSECGFLGFSGFFYKKNPLNPRNPHSNKNINVNYFNLNVTVMPPRASTLLKEEVVYGIVLL